MTKGRLIPLMLIAGVIAGAGGGLGAAKLMPSDHNSPAVSPEPAPAYVDAGPLIVPIVTSDKRLSGYVQFTITLEVRASAAVAVTAQLPRFLHAMNMRCWDTPLAATADKMLPDPSAFMALAGEAATASLGKGRVSRAIIAEIRPL